MEEQQRLKFSWLIPSKVAGHSAPTSVEDLIYLRRRGIKALVRMVEPNKAKISGMQVAELGFIDFHEPVPDFTAPNKDQLDNMIAFMKTSISAGRPVGVSCGAGVGRTGVVLGCFLVSLGYNAQEAINEVRAKRPGSIETKTQEEAVEMYQARYS